MKHRTCILLLVFFGMLSCLTAQTWYDVNWQYRAKITIDMSIVSGSSNLSNFPFLVNIQNAALGAGAQQDGDDILFTSSDGSTKLDHEIESYSYATGALVAWVRVPTLSYNSDTDLYMYYGNPSASNQQNTSGGVWDSNYKGVWHMTGDGTSSVYESTSNPNNGAKAAVGEPANTASGKIGGAQNFDGSNDFINCGSDASLDDITAKTIEFWTKLDDLYPGGIQGSHFINKGGTAYWFVATDASSGGRNIYASGFSTGNGRWSFPKFNTGTWYYVAILHNNSSASNDPTIYVNGVSQVVTEYGIPSGTPTSDASQSLQLSKDPSNPRWVDGIMDEVRISNIIRSEGWIKTQYNNQNSSSYITIGDDETLPVELSSFSAILTADFFVKLHWTTQSETSVSGFYIYRGLENEIAEAIVVSPLIDATNTTEQHSYEYVDSELFEPGTYYYWLSVQNLDGSVDYHGPTTVYYDNSANHGAPGVPILSGLNAIYPNPFNPSTTFVYGLNKDSDVSFVIYNSRGQIVRRITEGKKAAGNWKITWNGLDDSGITCSTGVYYIRMNAGKDSYIRKAVLLK